jgi:hypothetical protein
MYRIFFTAATINLLLASDILAEEIRRQFGAA